MRIEPLRHLLTASATLGGGRVPAILLLLVVGLAGCASGEYSDLQAYTQEVKSRPPGRIAPMPEFETFETFTYQSHDARDPFTPRDETKLGQAGTTKGTGLQPDFNRHKEALESFPLDGLEFVGTLENEAATWAIIKAPDKLVYRAKAGNHMGQNFGEVVLVDESKVQVVEIVPDGLGGWIKRQAALAIKE